MEKRETPKILNCSKSKFCFSLSGMLSGIGNAGKAFGERKYPVGCGGWRGGTRGGGAVV